MIRTAALAMVLALGVPGAMRVGSAAAAGPLPSATAPRVPALDGELRSGHAWVAARASRPGEVTLLHLPPRDEIDLVRAGTVRPAAQFTDMPEALAAWEDRVWVVFAPEKVRPPAGADGHRGEARAQRTVMMVGAMRTLAGTWEYVPADRPETLAPLPGDGVLVGLAGSPAGPVALLHSRAAGGNGGSAWSMLVCQSGRWTPTPLLPSFALGNTDPGAVRLITTDAGPGLLRRLAANRYELWTAGVPPAPAAPGASTGTSAGGAPAPPPSAAAPPASPAPPGPPLVWSKSPRVFGLEAGGAPDPLPPGFAVAWADGQVLPWAVRGGRLEIWTLKPGGVMPLAFAEEAPEVAGVVGLDGLGRAAVLWPQAPSSAGPQGQEPGGPGSPGPDGAPAGARGRGPEAPKFMYSEVSAYTGRQMFIGSARRDPLLSPRDFQVLSLVFGSLMIVVLLFVLRSDSRREVSLPEGAALAPPGMRVLAGAADLLPALGLAGLLTGVAPAKLLSLAVLTSPFSLTPLVLTTLGLVIGHCALSEWLWGRTLGKALVGCRVAPASAWDRVDGRLRLWQTVARNAVRWVFPPLGMLMLFDANFRHPGDVLARTMVVVPEPEQGPGGDEPGEE